MARRRGVLRQELVRLDARYQAQATRLGALRAGQIGQRGGGLRTAASRRSCRVYQVVDAYFPNAMGTGAKIVHYARKAWQFVSGRSARIEHRGRRVPGDLRHRR